MKFLFFACSTSISTLLGASEYFNIDNTLKPNPYMLDRTVPINFWDLKEIQKKFTNIYCNQVVLEKNNEYIEKVENDISSDYSLFSFLFWKGVFEAYVENEHEVYNTKYQITKIVNSLDSLESESIKNCFHEELKQVSKSIEKFNNEQDNKINFNVNLACSKEICQNNKYHAYKQCRHNDDGPANLMDVVEHIGNNELGSAFRDIWESPTVREYVRDICETIGRGVEKDFD